MAKKEKFGKFVLLEEIDSSSLGSEHRAAKLSQTGLEKIVSVLRLAPAISSNVEVAKGLMDQAKVAAQLQNPNIIKIFGIGKVEAAYYISYEFVEGKSLKAIFQRCRSEGFPFSIDHTLLIASKVCSALEHAHARKTDAGTRYFHGLLTPASVLVSYEGEVRVRGFGYWPGRVREVGLGAEERLYLAPEQDAGGAGDTRCDAFAVGAMLFEALTGHPLFEGGRGVDVAGRLAQAKLQNPTGEDDSLPRPIADILARALAADPAARYAEIQEMRKAIDTLLFSGDFTPTTFNLAFFMHSLFREDIERESKALKEEKESSYLEYLTEEPAKAPAAARAAGGPAGTVVLPPQPAPPAPAHAVEAKPAPAAPPPVPAVPRDEPHPPAHHEAVPSVSPREAAAGFTFHKEEQKSKAPLFAGVAVVAALVAAGGYFLFGRGGQAPPASAPAQTAPTTLAPEQQAALDKVKELEEKLRLLEEEKAAAEQKARDDAAAKVKKEAQARGEAVDTAALEKAQREAAALARKEQEKKAEEERKRLEEEKRVAEQKAAEEARLAAERAAQEDAARKAAEAAAAATQPSAPTTTLPALKAGALVNLSDVGVIAPVVDRSPALTYPPVALRSRQEGTVELNVLIDEKGNVTDAQVVTGAKGGLTEAAIDNVKKRKYRPASKDGVPVKVWMPVKVSFVLPK